MNILVITLGNSDIQIRNNPGTGFTIGHHDSKAIILKKEGLPDIQLRHNRNYTDHYLLRNPRKDGESINEHYAQFKAILEFPIITPLLNLFEKEGVAFNEVWWVYTDQTDSSEHFKESDTLYYKSILKTFFKEQFPSVHHRDYGITEKVKDIDFQYESFYRQALEIMKRRDEIDKIFLLAQGGIDQVNHALTLQLIQLFKEKIIIYQSAELSRPVQLQFTRLFLNDLTKHNVIKHIKDYDFGKAEGLILNNSELQKLTAYAAKRLNLLHDSIIDSDVPEEYRIYWNKLTEVEKKRIKLRDLVYSFKIQMKQRNFNDAIVKLFTISESMYKFKIEEISGVFPDKFFDKSFKKPADQNAEWERFILEELDPGYVEKLKRKKIHLNNPNAISLCYLYRWLLIDKKGQSKLDDQRIKKVNAIISDFRDKRNQIAHSLGSITQKDINEILGNRQMSIEEFYNSIDGIIGTRDLGIYENIRKEVLDHYGEKS
ncbi:MAG TPA: hypothetical protein PLS00_02115 [Niabella sp.]|nr:hypothetical protein [Agriterribacter sp.]HUN01625.1 hypothetical protein [Niabella sp.]